MSHIVLTEEQGRIIANADQPVEVRDCQGKWLGRIDPEEAAIVEEVLRRRNAPRVTIPGSKVGEHLRALQTEWDRLGGFDKEYMHRFLDELRSRDGS